MLFFYRHLRKVSLKLPSTPACLGSKQILSGHWQKKKSKIDNCHNTGQKGLKLKVFQNMGTNIR
jgi:hypothetical protein